VRTLRFALPLAFVAGLASASVLAQTKPAADAADSSGTPAEAALTVGALQIASVPNLEIAGFDIAVAPNDVTYSYSLKNNGPTDLAIAAAITLPELQASPDGSTTWTLAGTDPENPINLIVTAGGAPVTSKAEVHATALGVDRLAEVKAEHLPLIPFGEAADKAMAALSPQAADRLAAQGLVSPRDPSDPKTPLVADWALDVVRSWSLVLPAGKTTPVVIKFVPVVAHYRLTKGDEGDLNDMKDEICLKPQVLGTLQARIKSGSAWAVTDIVLADDAPARWIDSAPATLSVQKPKPDAIISFCGMDDKTAGKPTVLGAAPEDNEGIRILIFEPAAK
jgi:uncharacterized protein DUF4424